MDFLNPKKRRANKIRLYVGYVFMAILLMLGTTVLLYQAYGYDLGQGGQVYQNGLLYLSSTPSSAQIYLNGSLSSSATNSRLELPAGQYTVKLALSGYRSWQRAIGLDGGSVEHFDYPLLFPTKLTSAAVQQYASRPGLVSQSPSRRWLIVEQPGSLTSFTQYDLSNSKQLATNSTTLLLPPKVLTFSPATGQNLKLIAWSDDNNYLLIEHDFGNNHEYILFNRTSPSDSLNLTNQLQLSPSDQLAFNNNKYNKYYVFDSTSGALGTNTLDLPTITPLLKDVISFKTYGNDVVLYASASSLPSKVNINVLDSGKQYMVRTEPAGTTYLLNLTEYSGDWYVAIGATSDNRIYVYKNPMNLPADQSKPALVPDYILKISQPNSVEFSPNAQFIAVENGNNFAVYDVKNQKDYAYNKLDLNIPSAMPATWMDSFHLMTVSDGRLVVWDYDGANQQTLQPVSDGSMAYLDPDAQTFYSLAPPANLNGSGKLPAGSNFALTSTSLLARR